MRIFGTSLSALVRRVALAASAGLLAAAPAQAASYFQSLSFFTPSVLENGVIGYQFVGGGGGRSNSYYVAASGDGPSLITDPFVRTQPTSQLFFLGVSTESAVATDFAAAAADPVRHLVLAANIEYSTALAGQEFGDAFAGFSEEELIEALEILGDGGLAEGEPGYEAQIEAASTRLFQFQDVLFAANGGFGSEDDFGLTSFSIGTPAGTGFASTSQVSVPEPATWATMLLGFGLAGGAIRRRRGGAATA